MYKSEAMTAIVDVSKTVTTEMFKRVNFDQMSKKEQKAFLMSLSIAGLQIGASDGIYDEAYSPNSLYNTAKEQVYAWFAKAPVEKHIELDEDAMHIISKITIQRIEDAKTMPADLVYASLIGRSVIMGALIRKEYSVVNEPAGREERKNADKLKEMMDRYGLGPTSSDKHGLENVFKNKSHLN